MGRFALPRRRPAAARLTLRRGQSLRLRGEARWTVTCRRGRLWITQAGDARDVFLGPGERFELDRPGPALVSAWAGRSAVLDLSAPAARREGWLRRALTALAGLAVLLAVAGCTAEPRWALGDTAAWPTALDYWPEARAFVVGSYHDGTLYRVPGDGGRAVVLVPGGRPGAHRRALRVRVDGARGRLWVLDEDALHLYRLPAMEHARRFDLAAGHATREGCLPDLALHRASGIVYASVTGATPIYRIDVSASGPAVAAMTLQGPAGADPRGITALAVDEHANALYAASAESGALWRVDLEDGAAMRLPAPPVRGACGLAIMPREARPYGERPHDALRLYVTTGFGDAVVRIALSPDLRRGTSARVAPFMSVETPVSVVAFGRYLVVAASQLARYPDFADAHGWPAPFRLALLPTGLEWPGTRLW